MSEERINTRKIFELKQEIERKLQERPEYRAMQKELDEKMDNAGSKYNRVVIAYKYMMDSFHHLNKTLQDAAEQLKIIQTKEKLKEGNNEKK